MEPGNVTAQCGRCNEPLTITLQEGATEVSGEVCRYIRSPEEAFRERNFVGNHHDPTHHGADLGPRQLLARMTPLTISAAVDHHRSPYAVNSPAVRATARSAIAAVRCRYEGFHSLADCFSFGRRSLSDVWTLRGGGYPQTHGQEKPRYRPHADERRYHKLPWPTYAFNRTSANSPWP
jgi:hypothetical protein